MDEFGGFDFIHWLLCAEGYFLPVTLNVMTWVAVPAGICAVSVDAEARLAAADPGAALAGAKLRP